MKTLLPVLFVLVMPVVATSCAKTSGDKKGVPTDSVVTVEKVEIAALPDTAYASAGVVTTRVTVYDTVFPPQIPMEDADMYSDVPGALTFRKDPFRDADFGGKVDDAPSGIDIDWTFTTDEDYTPTAYGRWGGGTGWTGQPLYVEWPDSCMANFRKAGVVNTDFGRREIILGSLACKVYFINYDTGKLTRAPISTGGNPIKGTPSLDPTFNGNLYVGQGVPANRPFGAMVIDLNRHEVSHFTPEDPKAMRRWGAYDSSPLRVGPFLFRPGENGIIYKYTVVFGTLKLHSTLLYTVGGASPGIESSMSVYRNYGYTGDNHGNVLCINLSTMKPVWHYSIGDDIDASPVLAVEEGGHPYLYVCCEVDRRGKGDARMVKLDALTGQEMWVNGIPAIRFEEESTGKHFDGGYYSTPLLGSGNCSHMLFAHCVLNDNEVRNGVFVAIDRRDGHTVYKRKLRAYGWSSPVSFMDKHGKMYVFTADCYGNVYLLNGEDGEEICRRSVGNNFESSPVVHGNSVVIGSRGNKIFKLSIK